MNKGEKCLSCTRGTALNGKITKLKNELAAARTAIFSSCDELDKNKCFSCYKSFKRAGKDCDEHKYKVGFIFKGVN